MALVLHLLLSSRSCQRAAHKSWQQFNPMTALGFCRFWSKLAKILSNFAEIWRRMGSCYTAVRKLPVRWSQRERILQKHASVDVNSGDVIMIMMSLYKCAQWHHYHDHITRVHRGAETVDKGERLLVTIHLHFATLTTLTHLKEILTNLKKVAF